MPTEMFFAEDFNSTKIQSYLEPSCRKYLTKLEIVQIISSTNSYLLENSKQGQSGWICLAEEQTQGRGRQGKEWYSPPKSNIYCSLMWRFPKKGKDVSGLSIAIAVCVARALHAYGITGVQLKWPNDVLHSGRKLAGLLLERRQEWVIIGIGLNVYLPEEKKKEWIDLVEICPNKPDRNAVVGLILNEVFKGIFDYELQGLSAFIDDWSRLDSFKGQWVTLFVGGNSLAVGRVRGITEQGELVLQDSEGEVRAFRYGEVSVRLKK